MSRRLHAVSVAVLGGCLVLTGLAAFAANAAHSDTEQRLLQQRTDEVGALLSTAIVGVQTPLAVAAELAQATAGDPESFRTTLGPLVGEQFAAAALFDASGAMLASVEQPVLVTEGGEGRVGQVVDRAVAAGALSVTDTLDLSAPRLGLSYPSSEQSVRYVVYAESALPDPRTGVESSGPFGDLGFALYLGTEETEDRFLYSSETDLPIDGRRATNTVPFGDTSLLVVGTTDSNLGGWLSSALPWIVGIGGLLLAAAATLVTERLVRGRRSAEVLAANVSRLYDEQQRHTHTLQRSLLPREVVAPDALAIAVRYWPAAPELEIGGDFYDFFALGDDRWGVVIGDVCGKGVEAAALTGLARHTVRAAAHHVTSPVEVLRWAHDAIRDYDGDTYCTLCFAFVTVRPGRVVLNLALGGHPPPLVCRADGHVVAGGRTGTVLGLIEPRLSESEIVLGPGDTIVLYTDGITDAQGDEAIPVARLAEIVSAHHSSGPDEVAAAIEETIHRARPTGSSDDTALLVLQVSPSMSRPPAEEAARRAEPSATTSSTTGTTTGTMS